MKLTVNLTVLGSAQNADSRSARRDIYLTRRDQGASEAKRGEHVEPHAVVALLLSRPARGSRKFVGKHHDASSVSKAFAAFMSRVSKPSVNQS
jgi:hypothetical protein